MRQKEQAGSSRRILLSTESGAMRVAPMPAPRQQRRRKMSCRETEQRPSPSAPRRRCRAARAIPLTDLFLDGFRAALIAGGPMRYECARAAGKRAKTLRDIARGDAATMRRAQRRDGGTRSGASQPRVMMRKRDATPRDPNAASAAAMTRRKTAPCADATARSSPMFTMSFAAARQRRRNATRSRCAVRRLQTIRGAMS